MIPTLLHSRISSFTAFASLKKKGSNEPTRGESELSRALDNVGRTRLKTETAENTWKLQNQDNGEFEILDT